MASKRDDGSTLVAENRKARHEYFITDSWEAGIELLGSEVKSLRRGQSNIAESYASVDADLGDQRVAETRLAALCENLRSQCACPLPIARCDLDQRYL